MQEYRRFFFSKIIPLYAKEEHGRRSLRKGNLFEAVFRGRREKSLAAAAAPFLFLIFPPVPPTLPAASHPSSPPSSPAGGEAGERRRRPSRLIKMRDCFQPPFPPSLHPCLPLSLPKMNSQVSEFREKGNSPIISSKTSRGAISGQLQKEALLSFSSLKFPPNSSVPRGKILDPLLPLFSEWAAVPPPLPH